MFNIRIIVFLLVGFSRFLFSPSLLLLMLWKSQLPCVLFLPVLLPLPPPPVSLCPPRFWPYPWETEEGFSDALLAAVLPPRPPPPLAARPRPVGGCSPSPSSSFPSSPTAASSVFPRSPAVLLTIRPASRCQKSYPLYCPIEGSP